MINNFSQFLLVEKLHIHEDMNKLSNYIYLQLKNSKEGKYTIDKNIPESLNINKVIVEIKDTMDSYGEFDVDKSKKEKNGKYLIYITLRKGFYLETITHEMDHALRFTKINKVDILKKLNYIKGGYIFKPLKIDEIEKFFYFIYLSSDEEINSMIKEGHGLIEETINLYNNNSKKINKDQFLSVIKQIRPFQISNELIDFKIDDVFKNFSKNDLNKFFYIYEENKEELDEIQSTKISFFRKLKLMIKAFKDIFLGDKIQFNDMNNKIYYPKRGGKFYENWINSQGEKLKRSLFKLSDHYL
jgi:hypothetical protein